MIIGLDIDETIVHTIQHILPLYNQKYGKNLKYREIIEYSMNRFVDERCSNIFEEFLTDNLVKSLKIDDDIIDAIDGLSKKHDIFYVTARHPYIIKSTDNWLSSQIKTYKSKNLIVCRDKQLLALDVLVDDYELNLVGGRYRRILINKPWNKEFATSLFGITRIYGFAELPKIIEDMERRY